jgi:hypothetical protein
MYFLKKPNPHRQAHRLKNHQQPFPPIRQVCHLAPLKPHPPSSIRRLIAEFESISLCLDSDMKFPRLSRRPIDTFTAFASKLNGENFMHPRIKLKNPFNTIIADLNQILWMILNEVT